MILSVSDVDFRYNDRSILDNINFQLQEKELIAILGPNGVGKTTLLKCLNAINRPLRGTVIVEDRNVLKMKADEIASKIGYVPQRNETSRLTVFDAVLMGRKPYIRWKVKARDLKIVDSIIRKLTMEHIALSYLDEISGGELQKVAIARALVQEPQLMLLDEPTASLDLKSKIEILTMLRRVVDEHGIGGVMTMHDLNTAMRYADRVIFLRNGLVYSTSPVTEVTPKTIEEVYGVPVVIHTIQGYPVVVPV